MERNAYFDNAKLLLIFLVVFGHFIEPLTHASNSINTLYTWIYTFHMPAFIFLAGFFAKGSGNLQYIGRFAKRLLIPYVIFQTIYTGYYFFIGKNHWLTDHIFYPHWSLWFLVSLFCWHILLIVYKRMPAVVGILLSVTIGILIGYFDNIGHTFSLSRTFVFFPFFLTGYWLKTEHLQLLKRNIFKSISVIVLITFAVAIYYLPDINSGWLLASKSYYTLGLETFGGLARFSVYITSSLMALSVLVWIPERRFSFTKLGERTLYVYLLHGFIVQFFRQNEIFKETNFYGVIGFAILSVLVVFLLSSRPIVSIWQPFIEISTTKLRSYLREVRQLLYD